MTQCYFEGSHPYLAARLEEHFERLRTRWQEVAGRAQALALGGGYGRGEGGVLDGVAGPELFNDLDYFLFSDTPEDPQLAEWCRRIEKEETAALGVDVEIKRLPASDVRAGLSTMMFADLVAGHVAVAGDCTFLTALAADLNFAQVGAEDAARLLWNRGSGLFFARGVAARDEAFAVRNHAKLKLAMGDALLCLAGAYVPRCRERGKRFAELALPAAWEPLREWHRQAVDFKFRPAARASSPEELRAESLALADAWLGVLLKVEEARLKQSGLTLERYLSLSRLFPETPVWRNYALALRDRLKRGALLRPCGDYPRGALMRALPCLLELGGRSAADAARFLPAPAPATGMDGWQEVYRRWWAYYC